MCACWCLISSCSFAIDTSRCCTCFIMKVYLVSTLIVINDSSFWIFFAGIYLVVVFIIINTNEFCVCLLMRVYLAAVFMMICIDSFWIGSLIENYLVVSFVAMDTHGLQITVIFYFVMFGGLLRGDNVLIFSVDGRK